MGMEHPCVSTPQTDSDDRVVPIIPELYQSHLPPVRSRQIIAQLHLRDLHGRWSQTLGMALVAPGALTKIPRLLDAWERNLPPLRKQSMSPMELYEVLGWLLRYASQVLI